MYCLVTAVFKCLLLTVLVITPKLSSGLGLQSKVSSNISIRLHPAIYSFEQLVTSALFVDKTNMLTEFIESKCVVSVITRPRKWGKSVNMEMFKRFFEVEVNDMGIPIKISDRKNHKLFEGGEIKLPDGSVKVLKPLKIATVSTSMKLLGVSPVIMLKIGSVKGKNYRAVEDRLKREMKIAYSGHSYLKVYMGKENNMLNATEKAQLARYFSNKQLDDRELQNGLFHLCKLLFDHFRRKVVILIDEYDAAINHAVENFGESGDETQKLLMLFQNMFKSVINNPYMKKCLITGTLPFTDDALFPNVSNICVRSVLDESYSQSFGFSEAEVDDMLKKVLPSNITSIDKMKYWYNGYHHGKRMLYNPLDIMGYVSNQGRLLDYWVDSGRVKSLDEFLVTDEAQEDLQKLLEDEGSLKSLSKYDKPDSKEEGFHVFFGIFYRLLVHHGYLNAFKQFETGSNYLLRIPNQEIRNSFVEYKTQWFCTKHDMMISDLHDFVGCLVTNQLDELKESLVKVFANFKNSTLQDVKDYHSTMGEILNRLLNHNLIISNKHFELGKLYHMVVPRSKYQGHSAFVLEYAVLAQSNSTVGVSKQLQCLAQTILDHMDSNVYGPMLAHYKYVDNVVTLAVAFCRTELELAYRVFKQN